MKAYTVPGLSSERDLQILNGLAREVPEDGVIVEIGSFFGRSAVALAEGAKPSTKIYCIDYFEKFLYKKSPYTHGHPPGIDNFWEIGTTYDKKEEFIKFTKGYVNITPLVLENAKKVYPYYGELIDLLFLDCAHTNPDDLMNISYFKKFLKPNAVICGHDYHPMFPDVISNVKWLEKLYKTSVIFYENSTMWTIRT